MIETRQRWFGTFVLRSLGFVWSLVLGAWSFPRRVAYPIQPELVKFSHFAARAKKKEVSCSPQQEASQFWLFRTPVALCSKTHSRRLGIGQRPHTPLSLRQPP